jgi:hypothetical protein
MDDCDRTAFWDVIAFPPTQCPATEVPAGGRTPVVDSTTPLPDPAFVRRLFMQVPAGSIGKEKTVCFPKTAFAEVLQLVGFALPDENNGEPAAALSASAAGAGNRDWLGRFHRVITGHRQNCPISQFL